MLKMEVFMRKIIKYCLFGLIGFLLIMLLSKDYKKTGSLTKKKDLYIANNKEIVKLYNENFEEVGDIPRGTKVKVKTSEVVNEETNLTYFKINYDNKNFLIEKTNLV